MESVPPLKIVEVRFEDFEGKREFDLGDLKRIKRGENAGGEHSATDEKRVHKQGLSKEAQPLLRTSTTAFRHFTPLTKKISSR